MENQRYQESELKFSAAELGALAHLYRGDLYQTNVWRGRLDATTNWAVVTTGITLSVTFSSAEASPVPILLASWIVAAFLFLEARRYQYYDIFRVRLKVMEINFYAPISTLRFSRARDCASKINGTGLLPTTTGI
jgi:uncharacterized membrane protein